MILLKKLPLACGSIVVLFFFLYVFLIPPRLPSAENWSSVVTDRNGNFLRIYPNKESQIMIPMDRDLRIPAILSSAVIRFEDRKFYSHFGVDFPAIFRAFYQNVSRNSRISGASTLSMQVARMVTGGRRNIFNKISEMIFAMQLEMHYSKQEILKIYLSIAPYGKNIRGAQTASYKIFGKPLNNITAAQAALLAILPNSPGTLTLEKDRIRLLEKRNRLLLSMKSAGLLDDQKYSLALAEPIPQKYLDFPFLAPHFSDRFKEPGKKIISTLDLNVQLELERQAESYSVYLKSLGVKNLAAIIVDTQSSRVRGYLGNANYFDVMSNGFVDGVSSSRSTGSLLKPFLYGLSLDEGTVTVNSLVPDIPSYFGSFSPSNADLQFHGMVSISRALIQSLNIPAAHALKNYKVDRFQNFLQQAGMTTLFRSPELYGLTLILGGCEGRLDELASLYASLGRYGRFSPLIFHELDDSNQSVSLISEYSSFLILDQLKELSRHSSESFWKMYAGSKSIAWKTGTSYGQRDAWAIGTTPEWTVAVWIGNFDSDENANLKSAALAGPMMFNLFQYLDQVAPITWFKEPSQGWTEIELCTETGYAAGPACSGSYTSRVSTSSLPVKACSYHQFIYVNDSKTREVCSECWTPGEYQRISALIYSPAAMTWLANNGQPVPQRFIHNEACSANQQRGSITIVYPPDNAELFAPVDFGNQKQKITCKAADSNPEARLFWYLDSDFLGETGLKHEMALDLERGSHRLTVTNESGLTAVANFTVQ